tara:strand:+ start:1602 stop:2153 length:552 start_codon:yes stop_codon:yes gene_type:complete
MDINALERKKYPIGKFESPNAIQDDLFSSWVRSMETLPSRLEEVVSSISMDQLDSQYRPGSWTVRQVIHHLPDSHLNGYTRMKLALTEDNPTIKPYDENGWSLLTDVQTVDVQVSLDLLKNIHTRWIALIKGLNSAEMKRTFYHPANKVKVSVAEQVGLYAWHGEHHLSHIKAALEQDRSLTE